MWADNETKVDLLGFDYLVDSLDVLLTQPGLLPLTVGVLGDWGSGKTSLLQMAQQRLRCRRRLSHRLLQPVALRGLRGRQGRADRHHPVHGLRMRSPRTSEDKKKRLRKLRKMAKRLGAGTAGALKVVVRPAVSLRRATLRRATGSGRGCRRGGCRRSSRSGDAQRRVRADRPRRLPSTIESVTDFRNEFGRLLDDLKQVQRRGQAALKAVVVFIDDLDRCMDDTIIYVFEAIRLFLQVSSTAFVLAANRDIVQAAIDRRYPAAKEG